MRLEVLSSENGGLIPSVVLALAALPDDQAYFFARKQRHPYSLLTTSIAPLVDAMLSCSELLEDLAIECSVGERVVERYEDLLKKYLAVLYAADAFDDSLNLVVSHFFPSDEVAKKSSAVRAFRSATKAYRGKLGRTINAIKHRNCHLRALVFFGNYKGRFSIAPGVYVEGVQGPGVIGPDEDVHADGNSGFSLIRELRYYLVHMFHSCHLAEIALRSERLLIAKNGSEGRVVEGNKKIELLARCLSNSLLCMFPDEVFRKSPELQFFNNDSGRGLRLSFIEKGRPPAILEGRVVGVFRGDAVSRSYKIPYMGTEANRKTFSKSRRKEH